MISIDLNSKIITPDQKVYFVSPGKNYQLYYPIVESKVIIADLPFLELQAGLDLDDQDQMIERIHRSRAIRKWYREDKDDPFPSRNLNSYPATVRDLGISQLRAVVERYFQDAAQGDLVLVVPGGYTSDAYIGELTGKPSDIVTLRFPHIYNNEPLQGRKVKWLAHTKKKSLSDTILEISAKPNAFVLLQNDVRRKLYELAYPSFVWGDDTNVRLNVTEDNFTTYDDFIIQGFINFVATNTKAVAEGRDEGVLNFKEAAFVPPHDYTPDLSAGINSPGFLNLSSAKVVPLVVAALFVAASQIGEPAQPAAVAGNLRIGNSLASPDDACVAEVERLAIAQLVLLGADGWAEACEKARHAAQHNGIKGPAKVKR